MSEHEEEYPGPEEETPRYALRLRPQARRDIDTELVRVAELAGDEIGLDWLTKLEETLATLATMPRRFPLASESTLFDRQVRQMLFRRTPSGPAWRVLFTVEEDTLDGRVVQVRHIRHAASPLTEQDAGELLTDA